MQILSINNYYTFNSLSFGAKRGRKQREIPENFMDVYNSSGTLKEKSEKLKMPISTFRNLIDRLGLEFVPQKRKPKQYDFTDEDFIRIFFSKGMTVDEKCRILGIKNYQAYYRAAAERRLKREPITKERFTEVFNMNIPKEEKYKLLGIKQSRWYVYKKLFKL